MSYDDHRSEPQRQTRHYTAKGGIEVSKKYTIYAYKHFWPEHLNDPDTIDIPMPYVSDERTYVITAPNEKNAIAQAEAEYGSGERVDKNGQYIKNADGTWTLMGVSKVEIV